MQCSYSKMGGRDWRLEVYGPAKVIMQRYFLKQGGKGKHPPVSSDSHKHTVACVVHPQCMHNTYTRAQHTYMRAQHIHPITTHVQSKYASTLDTCRISLKVKSVNTILMWK